MAGLDENESLGEADAFLAVGDPFLELSPIGENPKSNSIEPPGKYGEAKAILISTNVRTLSSRKNGFLSVRSIRRCVSGRRAGSGPRSASSRASALSGGRGSSQSW
jgi:hypothetical protein